MRGGTRPDGDGCEGTDSPDLFKRVKSYNCQGKAERREAIQEEDSIWGRKQTFEACAVTNRWQSA